MQLDGRGPVRGRQGPGGASARGGIDARLMHRQTPGVWRGHEPHQGAGVVKGGGMKQIIK